MRLETETIPYKQLTHEVIQPIKGRATAITIIGTIIFLFLANWAVLWLGQAYPYNRGYWLVQQKWELLQGLSAPVDWLIVGDSTGNQGLVPDVMEARLGGTAVNLNTVGNMGALDDVWMLEAHIEEFGPPAHVLVIHAYDIWSRDITSAFVAKAPLAWNSWQDSFLPPLSATPLEKLNLWLARYVPLYADNLSLDRLIQDRVFLQRPIFRQRFSMQDDGFMSLVTAPSSSRVQEDGQKHLDFVTHNSFVMSDINQQALAQLVTLAEAHQIEVYLAFGPIYEGVAQEEAFQTYVAQVRAGLQTFADQSEHVHVLATTAVFPANQMENADHVILEAAEVYTNLIASEIEQIQK
jgi:hypothetical protein